MEGIRVITKATDRIAKFRDAKKMVRASGDARRGSTSKPMQRALKVRHAVGPKIVLLI